MKQLFSKTVLTTTLALVMLSLSQKMAYAQIVNKAIKNLGGTGSSSPAQAESGLLFGTYFVRLWGTTTTIGAFLVLGYFIWGAFDWLTSAGEKGKLESARNKMIHSVIGLVILVSLYTIIGVISDIFFGTEFNILKPVFFFN